MKTASLNFINYIILPKHEVQLFLFFYRLLKVKSSTYQEFVFTDKRNQFVKSNVLKTPVVSKHIKVQQGVEL